MNIERTQNEEKLEELRIVLVGKTGAGKSATGNTILGSEAFTSKLSSSSVTSQCEKARGDVDGREVAVIDTIGLYDTRLNREEVKQEIKKCICLSSPGPHVFLVVMQLGIFTPEEEHTVEMIQEIFGPQSTEYTMVLFTNGHKLKEQTIEEFLSGNKNLKMFTKQCHGGCHVFNNEDKQNHAQVSELMKKIDTMVEINGRCCYTNELFQLAEKAIEEKKKKILEENEKARQMEMEDLQKRLKDEALKEAMAECQKTHERKAREQAEKDNAFLNRRLFFAAVFGAAGAVAGAQLGPAGMAAGAAIGAGAGIVVSKHCTIQ